MLSQRLQLRTESDPCWNFPAMMFDNQRSVRSQLKKFLGQLAHAEEPQELIDATPKLNVLDDQCVILVARQNRNYTSAGILWRLGLATPEVQRLIQLQVTPESAANHTIIASTPGWYEILRKQLWYCLTLLDHDRYANSIEFPGHISCQEYFVDCVRDLVLWLPEFLMISDRISNFMGTCELSRDLSHIPLYRYWWASGLRELCWRLGKDLQIPASVEDPDWDLLENLVACGVVEIINGRTVSRL